MNAEDTVRHAIAALTRQDIEAYLRYVAEDVTVRINDNPVLFGKADYRERLAQILKEETIELSEIVRVLHIGEAEEVEVIERHILVWMAANIRVRSYYTVGNGKIVTVLLTSLSAPSSRPIAGETEWRQQFDERFRFSQDQ
ncbi:MAG: nuclear transport factor 2 family protein [Chloroflexi bacterium]|nr:nuclear transport factor 2 family protein [Chloroflexota bacterium]